MRNEENERWELRWLREESQPRRVGKEMKVNLVQSLMHKEDSKENIVKPVKSLLPKGDGTEKNVKPL